MIFTSKKNLERSYEMKKSIFSLYSCSSSSLEETRNNTSPALFQSTEKKNVFSSCTNSFSRQTFLQMNYELAQKK